MLELGVVSAGTATHRRANLENHAAHECQLDYLAPRVEPETLIAELPDLPITIPAGESLEIELIVRSQQGGTYQNRLDAHFTGGPTLSLPVTATVAAANLLILADPFERSLGCTSPHPVHLYNLGAAAAEVRMELTGEDANAFSVSPTPEGLLRVEAGEAAQFFISMNAQREGEHRVRLLAGAAALELVAEAFRAPRAQDVFHTLPHEKFDVLLVFDNAPAMLPARAHLEQNLRQWWTDAATHARDYRFAFLTTDLEPGAEEGRMLPLEGTIFRPGARFLTSNDAWSEWEAMIPEASGSTNARGLEAIQRALSEPLQSRHNAGFPHPDAHFYVTVISASDDHSTGPADSYLGDYDLQTIVGPAGGCAAHGFTAADGARYREAARTSSGTVTSLCRDRWDLSALTTGPWPGYRSSYFLSDTPHDDTIEVTVNGERWDDHWSYDASTNSINFYPTRAVPEGSEVIVSYEPHCARRD